LKTALGNLIYPRVLPSHSLTVICKSLKRAYKRYLFAGVYTRRAYAFLARVTSADIAPRMETTHGDRDPLNSLVATCSTALSISCNLPASLRATARCSPAIDIANVSLPTWFDYFSMSPASRFLIDRYASPATFSRDEYPCSRPERKILKIHFARAIRHTC